MTNLIKKQPLNNKIKSSMIEEVLLKEPLKEKG